MDPLRDLSVCTLALALATLTSPGCCADRVFSLSNGYIRVMGEGARITSMGCDPTGQGQYAAGDLRQLLYPELAERPDCRCERQGDAIVVNGLEVRRQESIEVPETHAPHRLEPGHTLGQTFTLTEGTFISVSIRTPTWHTSDSAATLTLRRDGPHGEVVVSSRLENVADNSTQRMEFAPQPAGVYYVELSEPVGQIGWWSCKDDTYAGGTAYADGQPTEVDRSLVVETTRSVGSAQLRLALQESTLRIIVELPAGSEPPARPAMADFRWDNTGHDVSPKSVPFSRFYTDNQRYLPAEQFKRAQSPGLSFGPCSWMEADGTGTYDLRIVAPGLRISWEMEDTVAGFRIRGNAAPRQDGSKAQEIGLTVLPRDDSLPPDWPAFETPDPALTDDLNRFWYERAFSYPAPCGPAAWFEWSATIRFWFSGPQRNGEAQGLLGAAMADDGYVHTWGGSAGWPFPDNSQFDTRHFDTNARFILACWRYLCWTHDERFLARQIERLRRAMEYQLSTLHGAEGLIISASKDVNGRHKGVGNNYWDILPFGHLDAYANAVYYASLEAMAQIEQIAALYPDPQRAPPAHDPAYYRELRQRVKDAYNQTFWDDGEGRYIGCVDVDGKRHDYGFTFVNLEAMAYGLASEQQARRIYDWMENGITSSGKADTYSRWVFAPRANTIHNPIWNEDGTNDPNAAGVEPWWHSGWRGTPFDEQCQDGGAILYTSYFDLMARTELLSPDNAWQRWSEILARYREPDRLCGGPPLYRGETPQQANPGSVGLDIPFPESGLVPTWFLYGLAGVRATPEGLVIAPRLPQTLPWLTIRNLDYRNLPLTLRVTNRGVRLVCGKPGYEFTWQRDIEPGGEVTFSQPPAPVPGFPVPGSAASGWRGLWIWVSGDPDTHSAAYLRKVVAIDGEVGKGRLVAAADNGATVYVNGKQALWAGNWDRPFTADITSLLRPGENVIAAVGQNAGGPAGVVIQGSIEAGGKTHVFGTGRAWRASETPQEGWMLPGFDDTDWRSATELGAPPCEPWGDIGAPGL